MITLNYYFPLSKYGDEELFVYEVSNEKVEDFFTHVLSPIEYDCKTVEEALERHQDEILDEYDEALKDYFEAEAYDAYREQKHFERDPDSFHGVSRKD